MTNKDIELRVTLQPVPFDLAEGERGRPQVNPRVYLSLVNTERLKREGWTEKQLRRRAFAQLRQMLGLPQDTVIVRSQEGDYFMVKSKALDTNLVVTVTPKIGTSRVESVAA
jgi:hypothetical protein